MKIVYPKPEDILFYEGPYFTVDRFFNFTTEGSVVIITNAYHKHSQKMTKQDLEELRIAGRYRQDYLRRGKEGTYYEA